MSSRFPSESSKRVDAHFEEGTLTGTRQKLRWWGGYRTQGAYTQSPASQRGPQHTSNSPETPPAPSPRPCPLNPVTLWCRPWEQSDSGAAAAAALAFSSSQVTSFLELEVGTGLGNQREAVSATEGGIGGLDRNASRPASTCHPGDRTPVQGGATHGHQELGSK